MRDIVMGKLVDHTIDDEYEDLSERLFGEGNCFNSSEVRKRMYGMRTIIEAIERDGEATVCDEEQLSALEARRIELLKERQKFFDQRNAFNKLIRERSRQEELNEILVEASGTGKFILALPMSRATSSRLTTTCWSASMIFTMARMWTTIGIHTTQMCAER